MPRSGVRSASGPRPPPTPDPDAHRGPGTSDAKALAEGPPWLIGFALFDGDSSGFGVFVRKRIHLFDRAWGRALHGQIIGDPRRSGPVYRTLRSKQRAAQDAKAARHYPRRITEAGGEEHHVLTEMQELAMRLGVGPDSLPAFAFRTKPPGLKTLVLRIEPSWYRSEGAATTLSKTLQEVLSGEKITALVEPGRTTVGDLASAFQGLLDQVRERMGAAVERSSIATPTPSSVTLKELGRKYALVIDEKSRVALYRGQDLRLSDLEFGLNLRLAMEAVQGPGWVTRESLINDLWSHADADYGLSSALRRLRAAYSQTGGCGSKAARSLLETRRRVGLRMSLGTEHIYIRASTP